MASSTPALRKEGARSRALLGRQPAWTGHTYTLEFVDGWASLLQPAGWTTQQADQLKEIVAADH